MLTHRAQEIDGVTIAELVRLADDDLTGEQRRDVEARVAASDRASEALLAQRRSLAATRAFAAPPPAPARTAPARLPSLRPALAVACTLLLLALGAGLLLDRRGGTIAEAADLSGRSALEPAPPSRGAALRRSFAGITFPAWEREFGWRATGARRDRVDGRATDTVYYQHTHHRIGYTVLAGRPLAFPSEGRRVVRGGVTIQLYHDGRRTVAVFERSGRTCVLAGVVHRESTLVKLASWRANGALTF